MKVCDNGRDSHISIVVASLQDAAAEIMNEARTAAALAQHLPPASSGDPVLDGALGGFIQAWRVQFASLGVLTACLGIALGASVDDYERTEAALAAALG